MAAIRRSSGCRINDELRYKGLKSLTMENEVLKIFILIDKGTDIIELIYKPKDIDFMWRSPKNFKEGQLNRGDFLESYLGGWQEIVPNGGSPCLYRGASLGQHDQSPMVPWDYEIIEDSKEKITVRFFTELSKIPLYIEKEMTVISSVSSITINEKVENRCNEEIDFMWGHHPCFGDPFISPGCIIDFKAGHIVSNPSSISGFPLVKPDEKGTLKAFPAINGGFVDLSKVLSPDAKVADLLYVKDLKENWFSITNTVKKIGIGYVFDKNIYKYLYFWFVYGGADGYPWYSSTYNIAIEPWSSYPGLGLVEAIKNKTSLKIMPGETKSSWLKTVVYEKDTGVERIDESCNVS